MASYVVAAALFIMGTSYLVQFVVEPPGASTSGLEHIALKSQGEQAMGVLLGTHGAPTDWGASSTSIDAATRLGILESGSNIRINTDKFDALARGKYATSSNANGAIDYAEAKAMLGLDGYEFHLRAYPVVGNDGELEDYGIEDMEDFDVAYVGHWDSNAWSATAQEESDALDNLAIAFTNAGRASNPLGDVFEDDSVSLRKDLLPSLGATIQEEVISNGAGTKYDFYRLDESVYDQFLTLNLTPSALSDAMALSTSANVMGYSKNRELRAILGSANLSDTAGVGTLATLGWHEWVDTDKENGTRDCGDYGYVEVSGDGGTTWVKLTDAADTRSQDCGILYAQAPSLTARTVAITGAACAACIDNEEVLIGFHWIADNDNNAGYGWVVDNVQVMDGSNTMFRKTFSTPEYDMLIIGSDVTHNAFTPEEIKAGIRDYVDVYGGRIMVLGGQTNVQWLDRLFDAAVGGASGGVAAPDNTHPVLTLPNELDYTSYVSATPWDFSSSDDAGLFSTITGSDEEHAYLTVSRQGAWGGGNASEGAVILTSYKPGEWEQEEARKFFANTLLYGRFHYLYLEVGPPVPDDQPVASVARSATMNKHREGYEPEYVEMTFILYVWPGASVSETLAATSVNAMEPRDVTVEATDGQIWVNWSKPLSTGTQPSANYEVRRGNGPTSITTLVANVTVTDEDQETYSYHESGLTNGLSYWYNVTLITKDDEGTPAAGDDDWFRGTASDAKGAVPVALPNAPTDLQTTNGAVTVQLDWTMPTFTGPGPLYGYAVWGKHLGDPSYELIAEIGNVTTYTHSPPDADEWVYTVAAINARGYGPNSTSGGPGQVLSPAGQPPLVVTNATPHALTLAWTEPELGGSNVQSYHIDRSDDGENWVRLAESENAANVSFVDEEIDDNATYYYRVAAVTAFGDGAWSDTASKQALGAPWTVGELTKTASVNGVSVTFTWEAPNSGGSPITGYEIFRGLDENTLAQVDTALTASYTDLDVDGESYFYAVRGVNAVGDGELSDPVQMRMTASAPILSVSNLTAARLEVSWLEPLDLGADPVDGYRFERSADGGSTWTQLPDDETLLANTSWTDLDVEANGSYSYRVGAVTAAGDGTTATGSKQVLGAPWTVAGLARSGGVNGVSTSLSWDAANTAGSAILSYEIARSSDNSEWTTLGTTALTSYTDLDSQASAPYYYKVRATNVIGDGPWSAAVYAANAPSAPTLTVTNGTAHRLDLSWTTPATGGSSITGYKIFRSVDGAAWTTLATMSTTNVSWVDATTSDNTTYYYRVAATNAVGDGTNSSSVSKTTIGVAWPASVTLTNSTAGAIGLSWSAPNMGGGSIVSYRIERSSDNSSWSLLVNSTGITSNRSWTDASLTANTTYYYRVTAYTDAGMGGSGIGAGKLTQGIPWPPTGLVKTLGNTITKQITMAWDAPANDGGGTITGYEIYRGTSVNSMSSIGTTTLRVYTDSVSSNAQTYYYKVRAINAVGNGNFGAEVGMTTAAI